MKTSKLTTLGLAALLTACSGKTEYVANNYNGKNAEASISGVPISTSVAFGQGSGSISIIVLEKGKPVLAQSYCNAVITCSNAEALVKSKMQREITAGEITLNGIYEDNVLQMTSIIAGDYKVTF